MSIGSFLSSLEADLTDALHEMGEQVVAEVQESISQPSPPPSAPGDPPHLVSGHLRDSIGYSVTGTTLRIGSDASYAIYLEFGTSRMAARPFLRPANLRIAQELPRLLRNYLTKPRS